MHSSAPYDALLLLSFGGPDASEDIVPFLRNVTAGRGIPDERLAEVGKHYHLFGGRSPINEQNQALIAAIEAELASREIALPVYWGNRNWRPYLTDALAQMAADGIQRAAVVVTSAYSSYSGCRQYRENLAAAAAEVPDHPRVDKLRAYFHHPLFVEIMIDATLAALDRLGADGAQARLVFVTHSIPTAMNANSGPEEHTYVAQHEEVRRLICAAVAQRTGRDRESALVYCSRSGPPMMPWLEPDINDDLEEHPTEPVVVIPIGFISDHMEVIYDLDTEASQTADKLGLPFARAATAATDPRFAEMIVELLLERAATERGESPDRPHCGAQPVAADVCPAGCCAGSRPLPTLCGAGDPT